MTSTNLCSITWVLFCLALYIPICYLSDPCLCWPCLLIKLYKLDLQNLTSRLLHNRILRPHKDPAALQMEMNKWLGMDTTILLLTLKQGTRSLESYTQEFLATTHYSNLSHLSVSQISQFFSLPDWHPAWSIQCWCQYVQLVSLNQRSQNFQVLNWFLCL